jgi:glycosyltransferase involved in cell wall biosynthesis
MRVLLTVASLLPEYGGPAFSVSRLALALAEKGAEVGLWASDQTAAVTSLLPARPSVQRIIGTVAEALDRFGRTDVLHDNGMWLPHNHRLAVLAARFGIPRVVSTRGMLEPWALSHKTLKKRIAWRLYQRRDLKQAHCHHATAETEARNLRCFGLGIPIVAVPNGVDVPEESAFATSTDEKRANSGQRTALFLGRIYPVKGLPMLVEAWARVRPAGWHLRIAGPDEAGHQREIEKAVAAAGIGDVVSFTGPVGDRLKKSAFLDADLFVLPTHSESFGMVIAEALAHGLPVLTTKGAPWPMLPQSGCGWWVDATVDGIARGLQEATSLEFETLQAMGAKGRTLVAQEFGWPRSAKLILSVYEEVLARNHIR